MATKLKIPVGFDEALTSLLQVKPPPRVAKPETARTAKRPAKKRTAKKR